MARTRAIRKRMEAVRTIRRITKTMQMIATAKFTASLHRAHASRPFAGKVRTLVEEVAATASDLEHPLLAAPSPPVGRELLLTITSDRGLCGAYNANVLRTAMHHLRRVQRRSHEFDLETSGKKARAFFKFQRIQIAEFHTLGDKPDYHAVQPLADRYLDAFAAGGYDAVRVAFVRFVSNARQVPEVMTLLPLQPQGQGAERARAEALYELSPSSRDLLDELLPLAVKVSLFQAFLEAVVSEQIMRMVAMKAATENAVELGKMLTRRFNRARQSQITTELTEIMGGAAALE
ncbi:MAG: ATP synthase F1 subunit gamma [Planctomycetota bacterium]|jgi:F-type H+-transporting ATPase subunit gamma